jgi:hypothetical protein
MTRRREASGESGGGSVDGETAPPLPAVVIAHAGAEIARVVQTIVAGVKAVPPSDTEALAIVLSRALRVIDIVSAVLTQLRPGRIPSWASPAGSSPIRTALDPLVITDYLLDPSGSDERLDELRRYLIDLVSWEAFALAPTGHA